METRFAPCYANLFLAQLEAELYKESKDKYGVKFVEYIKDNCFRYWDDCFVIWNRTWDIDLLNEMRDSLHTNMRLTM